MGHIYILFTIVFTVYGQLILKWQVGKAGALPDLPLDKLIFCLKLIFTPWIFSGLVAAFLASLCWMAAMTKFQLSYAYPFMSLSFVLVLVLSAAFFHEPLTWTKAIGMALLVSGVVIGSQG